MMMPNLLTSVFDNYNISTAVYDNVLPEMLPRYIGTNPLHKY